MKGYRKGCCVGVSDDGDGDDDGGGIVDDVDCGGGRVVDDDDDDDDIHYIRLFRCCVLRKCLPIVKNVSYV